MVTYKDEAKEGTHICGFCSTSNHNTCKGAIRNGDLSLYFCPCPCVKTKTPHCTQCYTTDPDNLGRPWLCDDREACDNRVHQRVTSSPLGTKIAEIRQRTSEVKPVTTRPGTKPQNTCQCCGEPTKGGKFLPGHDSTWLKNLAEQINNGTLEKDTTLDTVTAVSEHLAKKLEKRLK